VPTALDKELPHGGLRYAVTLDLRSRVPQLADALAAYNGATITLRDLKVALTGVLRATPIAEQVSVRRCGP